MSVNFGRGTVATAVAAAAVLAALILLCVGGNRAEAKAPILSFSSSPSLTQAGGHPDIVSSFLLGNFFTQNPKPDCGCDEPKDVILHAPAGVIANPHVVATCTLAEFTTGGCSPDAQAGLMVFRISIAPIYFVVPVYRTVPQQDQGGLFFFLLPFENAFPQYTVFNARTGSDYGLDIETIGITHASSPEVLEPIFWGVPADPIHNPLRFDKNEKDLLCIFGGDPLPDLVKNSTGLCSAQDLHQQEISKASVPSSLPVKPLTQNPTSCVGPTETTLETIAYDGEVDKATSPWPETTGCDQLSFAPSLSANPTTSSTDTASGVDIKLRVPQFQDPTTPSPSEIKATTVRFPEGFSLNPNAADGKTVCTDEEAAFGTRAPAACPETAKVGTLSIDSSALPGPISGALYLGEPKPGDRYRVILTAFGFGTAVKIGGSVKTDPSSGQLEIVLDELPETPFQEFDLHVFGAERGLLATPDRCGTYPVRSTFTPWDEQISDQTSTQFFTIDSGPDGSPCPQGARPFHPHVEAGSQDNTAGKHSPFSLRLTRADGEQNLSALDVTSPPGFTATLKGVPYCPESAIRLLLGQGGYSGLAERLSPACPASSQVGTVWSSQGAGTKPLYTPGKVYFAGPYKGRPYSLVVVIPAVSGPYDLGNVAVRVALGIDPRTAQVSAISDPLPQIIEGIPIRLKSILLNLDRPSFALNPTNCSPFTVDTQAFGNEGGSSTSHIGYQAANCTDLPFKPKLALRVSGGVRRTGNPALHATLTTGPGEANIARTVVTLPHSEFLDNSHLNGPCTNVQFVANACPPGSVIGHARATSPLLAASLEGPVYLRTSQHKLPDLVADLHGPVHIELVGRIDSVKQRLRTTFESVPDVPVSEFRLDLLGGKKGLLENSENLCEGAHKAHVAMRGQNGAQARVAVPLRTPCNKAATHKKKSQSSRASARTGR